METNWLKQIAVYVARRKDTLFSYDVKKQKKYIEHFSIPMNDFERSFYQYKCQMKLHSLVFKFAITVASLPVLIAFLATVNRKRVQTNSKKVDAVFIRNGIPENVLPDILLEKFETIEKNPRDGKHLSSQDYIYLKKIFTQYPFSWHFLLKNAIKISQYSYVKEKYSPNAIIVCGEYSFTSSLLTDYCNKNQMVHIDVMHGEKLFYMRDSFFRFDKCYIWDEHYRKLFNELRAEQNQFEVALPDSMVFKDCKTKKIVDFTFYLTYEKEEEMEKIAYNLKILQEMGYEVNVRPHPRYTELGNAKKIFAAIRMEDTNVINIEQSILQTQNVISLYSTVLNQAIHNNVAIVIDDITDKDKYLRLKETEFICLNKEHRLLSDIIKKESIK